MKWEAKCRITVIGDSIDTKDLMASTKDTRIARTEYLTCDRASLQYQVPGVRRYLRPR